MELLEAAKLVLAPAMALLAAIVYAHASIS
jgi:hypothetical protein